MKLIRLAFIFALGACSLWANPQAVDFSQKSKPATIKVLISRKAPNILLEVKGRHCVFNPLDGTQISSGILSKRYSVSAHDYGLLWGEKFPGIHQIRVVPGDSQSTLLVNGIQYKGCIEIYSVEGKINVVNEVDVENFLKSTLTLQFPEPMEDEAMNALAIVARTNAYFMAARNRHTFWHIDAQDCGYQGSALVNNKLHVDRAIETTRHAILTFQNTPFAATWTKDSAGRTTDFASIFRKSLVVPPGVSAPLAAKDRTNHSWSLSISRQSLAKMVNLPMISSIDLYQARNSEKVYAVKISGGGASNDIDFFTLQKVLGAAKLKSNDFIVSLEGDSVVFSGFGEGPGVGLCLYSAKAMAARGEKAPSILAAFFPSTQLEKVRSSEKLAAN